MKTTSLSFLFLALLVACGSSTSPDGGKCTPGQSVACVGAGGCQGGQTCQADGQSFGTCQCSSAASSSGAATSAAASTSGTGAGNSGTGGTTGGVTGTGSTGGTGAGPACAPEATWAGNDCVVSTCTPAVNQASCALNDGGIGACLGSSCLDVATDPANCGTPGFQCATGLTCVAGKCTGAGGCSATAGCPAGTTCYEGLVCLSQTCTVERTGLLCGNSNVTSGNVGQCCGTTCTDLQDPQNCGACGVACDPGKFCAQQFMNSEYVLSCTDCTSSPDNTPCPSGAGGFCCGGTCMPYADSDPLNCGYCGLQCPGGAAGFCTAGVCAGDCNTLACAAGAECLDYGTSFACAPTSCVAGAVGSDCITDQGGSASCCGGTSCVRLDNDASNCGGCGIACGPGEICQSDSCIILPTPPASCATESDGTLCTLGPGARGLCCSGTCTDTSGDAANCGACGSVCPSASTCVASACNNSSVCQTSEDCPAGVPCVANYCSPSCAGRADGERCAETQSDSGQLNGTCCGGACAPTATDPGNCGGCGLVCPAGYVCDFSACHQGASAFLCGAPGIVTCPVGTACAGASSCTPVSCAGRANGDPCAFGPGLTGECCGGVCQNVNGDVNNCGGCGLTCPSALSFCNSGACTPYPPATPCTPACQSDEICLQGQCYSSLCTGGYQCLARDGQAGICCGRGACSDVLTDPANCGNCGTPCPAGETCSGGVCQGDSCSYANMGAYCSTAGLPEACCGNACVDTATDPFNCGACNNPCASGTCQAGTCG